MTLESITQDDEHAKKQVDDIPDCVVLALGVDGTCPKGVCWNLVTLSSQKELAVTVISLAFTAPITERSLEL